MTASMEINRDDVLLALDEYLTRAIPNIHKLSDEFYRGSTPITWNRFDQLIEAVQWISQTLPLFAGYTNGPDYEAASKKVGASVTELASAVENNDTVLIADCLHYEILPFLTELAQTVKNTIRQEVQANDTY
ncbi:hypothetical protein [Paenibacillus thermotolerans]|uniref:hypothetical protein n=1 Tax=Paenibacillus thermotolerans TaxID=3027807 RepID=UPI002367C144|nr:MULTISPECIES: hypothetical protein [unclassified Paenibacillus]